MYHGELNSLNRLFKSSIYKLTNYRILLNFNFTNLLNNKKKISGNNRRVLTHNTATICVRVFFTHKCTQKVVEYTKIEVHCTKMRYKQPTSQETRDALTTVR